MEPTDVESLYQDVERRFDLTTWLKLETVRANYTLDYLSPEFDSGSVIFARCQAGHGP